MTNDHLHSTPMNDSLLEGLNEQQRIAVTQMDGPILVLAGAGSGKTRVITHRIAYLIAQGIAPRRILAVTFTNKAAAEMRERVQHLVGPASRDVWVSTFHAACARILRRSADRVGLTESFSIYDADDQKRLMKHIFADIDGAGSFGLSPAKVLASIASHKHRAESLDVLDPESPYEAFLRNLWAAYEKALRRANAVDFGDLLNLALKIIRKDAEQQTGWATRWTHVLVDEFQDTNRVQYLLAKALSGHSGNLCVVGDDDQSIYSWRGADLNNILDFEDDHPGALVVKLEQNYRSTATILQAASSVIRNNQARKDKTLWTAGDQGEPIEYYVAGDERDEARYVARIADQHRKENRLSDMAVFYRVHAQSRVLEEALRALDIPYRIVGGIRFYDRAEIKDMVAYLRLIRNPASDLDLLRIVNVPRRGIGATTMKKVRKLAVHENLNLLDGLRRATTDKLLLPLRTRNKLSAFVTLIDELRQSAQEMTPSDLAETLLARTGYVADLAAQGTEEAQARIDNLAELVNSISDYESEDPEPTLEGFLEKVALSSAEDKAGPGTQSLTLMTVHAAKGLEFPTVVVTGLEEGVMPHFRSLLDGDVEEERRLVYVAMTRARKRLYLTRARVRSLAGQTKMNEPARFVEEIPAHLLSAVAGGGRGSYLVSSEDEAPSWTRGRTQGAKGDSTGNLIGRKRASPARRAGKAKAAVGGAKPILRRASIPEGDDASQARHWRTGMPVQHPKFGVGVVTACKGSPPNEQVSVFFSKHGTKTILANYLTPL